MGLPACECWKPAINRFRLQRRGEIPTCESLLFISSCGYKCFCNCCFLFLSNASCARCLYSPWMLWEFLPCRFRLLRDSPLSFSLYVGCHSIFLGDITAGVCRHRSILFKAIADSVGIPCRLVRSVNLVELGFFSHK